MAAPVLAGVVISGGNWDYSVYPLLARTAAPTKEILSNQTGSGIEIVVDVTVIPSSSVTMTLLGYDGTSGKIYTILAGAAITTVSTNVYWVFRGAAVGANISANRQLPKQFQIQMAHADGTSITYQVGISIIK